jgi:hypothetical protein
MYWWNVSKLAEDLREGRVTEKDRFMYFLATVLAWTAVANLPHSGTGTEFPITEVAGLPIAIAIALTGTIICYRANRSGDNTDFIGRMVCLGWPILVKVFVLAVVTGFAVIALTDSVGMAMGCASDQIQKAWDLEGAVWSLVFGILYCWQLYKYVRLVAQPKEAS